MPIESRLFVKTSLVYLAATFLAGIALTLGEVTGHPPPFVALSLHGHLGFVGWLVNVVMGIALWFLPLARDRYPQTQGRYPPGAPYLCYALLNGGLLLRIVAEPWWTATASATSAASYVLSGILQAAGVFVFAAIAWSRVKPPARPAPGVH